MTDKAELYAEATGYHVARLVTLREGVDASPGLLRPMAAMALQRSAAPTPVEPGELTVRIEVTGEYELKR